jgi:hypothetical protein
MPSPTFVMIDDASSQRNGRPSRPGAMESPRRAVSSTRRRIAVSTAARRLSPGRFV